jgi:carbamate kinase
LPLRIIGLDAIKALLDADHCVICAGGGGIPVMRNADGDMEGVEAVIDKDRTSALLALGLDADALLLLTDVAAVVQASGKLAGIGQLTDARAILDGHAGTRILPDKAKPRRTGGSSRQTPELSGEGQPVSVWLDDGGAMV